MTDKAWGNRWAIGIVACGVGVAIGYSLEKQPIASESTDYSSGLKPEIKTPISHSGSVETKEVVSMAEQPEAVITGEAAITWLFGESEDAIPADDGMMQLVMTSWAERDPDSAQSWLMNHLDHPGAKAFIAGIIDSLVVSDPVAAMEWAQHSPTDYGKARAWARASIPILFSDPDQAEQLLEKNFSNEGDKENIRQSWNRSMAASQRNAQNIVSVFGAAKAAGAEFAPTDVESLIGKLSEGMNGSGNFSDSIFKISPLSRLDREMVKAFVDISETGSANYRPPEN